MSTPPCSVPQRRPKQLEVRPALGFTYGPDPPEAVAAPAGDAGDAAPRGLLAAALRAAAAAAAA
ncbi:hypothetical protein, partial [Geodermatophilus sp. CPCC 206100]|uniref:hypothetical protein n=1 Tax=Geodermatophilus sp. CPCC 206100 TaxID=3020054 RepID=UPI003B00073A